MVAFAVVAVPAPAAAARGPATVGRAFYEAQRQAIVVPFEGTPPNAHHFELSGSHHYFELTGARLKEDAVQHQPVGGALKRYTLAPRGAAVVRLAYELTFDAQPAIRLDAANHRFEIFPFGQEVRGLEPPVRVPRALALKPGEKGPAPLRPTPAASPVRVAVRTAIATHTAPKLPAPKLPALIFRPRPPANLPLPTPAPATALYRPGLAADGLIVPFRGTAPGYEAQVFVSNPRWVYFEFDGAGLTMEGQRFGVLEDPTIEAWMFTQPAAYKTRLYLRLRHPAKVVCEVDEKAGELRFYEPSAARIVPTPTPEPEATPSAAEPRPPVEPGDPGESAQPLLYPRPDSAD